MGQEKNNFQRVKKDGVFKMSKEEGIKKLKIKMSWKANKVNGQTIEDLDLAIIGLSTVQQNGEDKDIAYSNPYVVFWGNQDIAKNTFVDGKKAVQFVAPNQSIVHYGDIRQVGEDGDAEYATIDLEKLPEDMTKIALICSTYDDENDFKNAKLYNYNEAKVEITEENTKKELLSYTFSDNEDFKNTTSVIFGFLEKTSSGWQFKAVSAKDDTLRKAGKQSDSKGVFFFIDIF